MRPAALALAALASCSYSLEDDAAGLRTEIVGLKQRIPPEAPLWISEGPQAFAPFLRDSTPHVPDFIYHHLLRRLHALDEASPDAQAQGDFDREACEKDPEKFRGRFWRVGGVIADLHPEPVDDPGNPVRTAHAGVFFDGSLRPILFHVVDKPEVLTLRDDTVETRALFVKIIEYTSRGGRKVAAPLFIGKTLRRTL